MTATNNLAFLRTEKGLSQEKLAEMLDVSRQTISRWESGETLPSTDNLIRLSQTLGVSVDYLMGNTTLEPKIAVAAEERPESGPQTDILNEEDFEEPGDLFGW